MRKSLYLFICFILGEKLWNLSYFSKYLTEDTFLIIFIFWSCMAFILYSKKSKLNTLNNNKYMLFILLGVFISMTSAYFNWGQSLLTTFFTQRGVYAFIMLPAILHIRPSERDIIIALKWMSLFTIIIWVITIFNVSIIKIDDELLDKMQFQNESSTDIGYSITGIYYVVLYLYIKLEEFIKNISIKKVIEVMALLLFFILYQNRSMLLGIIPIFLYSISKFKSNNKPQIIIILLTIITIGIINTSNIWSELFDQTQNQIETPDYNRWKSLNYYLYDYSPNSFSYIFGNGFPSAHSSFGQLMQENFKNGIFSSDLGMIGMWVQYGFIPLISIYFVLFSILKNKAYPLFLKFLSLHILLVPIIFHFRGNSGVILFVIIFYMFAYYKEVQKFNMNTL